MKNFQVPKEIAEIVSTLIKAGYKAYVIGGCVRDLLLGREPKDWDVTTNATPEEIQKIFPDTVYENEFGTVAVKTGSKDLKLTIVEVTTFRKEEKYSDLRHPDKIEFTDSIEEDLARRDFTVNAIALQSANGKSQIVDPFNGQEDLKNKIIRAVGDPAKRFNEDALRLMRAVRFAAELGFTIEEKTTAAIKKSANLLAKIAKERIRDEFAKIIMSDGKGPYNGVLKLEELGLLAHIIPEVREGIGVGQNKHHIYTVWEHNLLALDYAASKNHPLEIRLAALLHDVGKPRTKAGEGPDSTFYNHDVVGAKMTRIILGRLKFSSKLIDHVTHLVRYHLFYYNVGEVTEAGIRRFIRRVGEENIEDLLKVREADRIGSGVPKAFPYKLRHLKFMIEKVRRDPTTPKMLAVKGDDVMKILDVPPGPKIGWILNILLEEVLDDPAHNTKQNLESRIFNLGKLPDEKLKKIAENSKKRKEEFESGIEAEIKQKYYIE
ncbi:MAG: HD domain-containing protein [Candidatus Sungbacteria bacterium]|uniref:HD domain-containing protein n=1 Tax=Candidatus Sungiibacteriota bacterium TaxID=2750080 RepID=A0A931SBA9_9BACT|nr:HD domain-containing protein [Candidatus Sungbacteria bacterium]